MARGDDGMGIIADCKRLEGDRTAALIAQAVGLSLPDLRKDPRQPAGQLVGRLVGKRVMVPKSRSCCNVFGHSHGFRWWCPVSPVLEQAGGARLKKLEGHTDLVGPSLSATASRWEWARQDGEVWDVESGAEPRKFEAHSLCHVRVVFGRRQAGGEGHRTRR